MTEIIEYYAKCNRIINEQMNKLLATLPEPYAHQLKGYFFKTIGEILDHIYIADMNWMKAFLEVDDYGLDLQAEVGPIPRYGEPAFDSFASYLVARQGLDAFICRFAGLIQAADFGKMVTRTNRHGEKMQKLDWKCLIHFFNHQTHHRGQISLILDDLQIENNYSNMVFID